MFGKKKTATKIYNLETHTPVLKCSICTGEQVAGFKDIRTGKFEDVMLIKNEGNLSQFKKMYNINDIQKEY